MRQMYALGAIWIITLVLTAGITWIISLKGAPYARDVGEATETALLPALPEELGDEENLAGGDQALREELDVLKARYVALSKDYFSLSLAKWAAENHSFDTDPESITNLWDRKLDSILEGGDRFNFESQFTLMFAFATYGDAGIGHLDRIINDRGRSLGERETALLVLRYMATPRALETILAFRDPELTQLDYPYDLISFQLKMIRTDAIRHNFPGILAQVDEDLGADDFSPERVEVLLTLASTHANERAQQLLRDPRVYHENVDGAIALATTLDSAIADEFLLNLAENHELQHVRQSARYAYAR